MICNMTGKPYSLLRFGYPETGEEYFEIEYYNSTRNAVGEGDLPLHKHNEPVSFLDDDFFDQSIIQEKLDNNYTFALQYTGRRWYGKFWFQLVTLCRFTKDHLNIFVS